MKVMLTVFFDYKGVVQHAYAPDGQTVNKKYYVGSSSSAALCSVAQVTCVVEAR
jgi:hypothetical protein